MADSFQEKELRAFVDMKLRDPVFLKELYKEMRVSHTKEEIDKMDADEIYRFIVKKGLLEHLVTQTVKPGESVWTSGDQVATQDISLDDILLKMTIAEGKGFTDYLENNDPRKKVKVSVSFLKNRKMTRPVQASSQPIIDQVTNINLRL